MTVNITLAGTQRDYDALMSLFRKNNWRQLKLECAGETFYVRQKRISANFNFYTFSIEVPDEAPFRDIMNRLDLIGIESPSKVTAEDLQGHNLIYW